MQVLLKELARVKQTAGENEGRELTECKVMLKDVSRELALAHGQQQRLEAERDKAEASLLDQLQGSCKDLARAQSESSQAKEQIRTLTATIESTEEECARLQKEHAAETEKFEAQLRVAEQANLALETEKENLQNERQKYEGTKGDLQAKLQTVWLLAARGASHSSETECEGGTSTPLQCTPSRKQFIELKSATPRSDLQSDHDDEALYGQDDSTCTPHKQTDERTKRKCRGQTDSTGVPSSPSGIVDGLQRHIKDLMRSIEIRDSQVNAPHRVYFRYLLRSFVFVMSQTDPRVPRSTNA